MSREFKALPFTNLKAQSSGRVRVGIASVFGNIDEINDRVMPGAFEKTIAEGARRARFLWMHSYQHPPTAAIKELRELTRDELPPEVVEKAPEATGGLLVARDYFKNDLADWILQAIDAGEIDEMSFAYETVRSQTVTEPIDGDPDKVREIRNLQELKLYDLSDVLWGCNEATVAAGAKGFDIFPIGFPIGVIASQLSMLSEQMKAGRRNSESDMKLINLIHDTAMDLGAVCNPDNLPSDEEPEKAHAAAVDNDTAPVSNWLDLQKVKTRVLALQIPIIQET
jgi:HK97 family phage prohead protease